MPRFLSDRPLARAAGRLALVLWSILGTAGCEAASTTAADPGVPFVLTTRGEPVRASSPPGGVEVTLGAKRVLPTGAPSRLD
jgi:hypothetical protein